MVNVGELSIGASINTEEIDSGLRRISKGFDIMESKTGGINSDFERMANTGSRLNKLFLGMAVAGTGAMLALAKGAPAVAGSMAKMKVKVGELSRSLGRILAPAFESVSDAFAGFVDWIEGKEGTIGFFVDNVLGGFVDGLKGIRTAWTWITDNLKDFQVKLGIDWDLGATGEWLLKNFGPEVVGAGIGAAIAGPPGAVVGGVGVAIGRGITDPVATAERTPKFVGGILSLISGFSASQLRRIIGLTLTDNV